MKVLDPGHKYSLQSYDNPIQPEEITFMKRIGERYPGNTGEPYAGTNCQESIRVLIDRFKYLYNQIPCDETAHCITLARCILVLLEQRAKRVKGKELIPSESSKNIEEYTTCPKCGHILCEEDHL